MIRPRRQSTEAGRRLLACALAASAVLLGARGTQDAIANGDTRSLDLYHAHTQERLRVTFRRDGSFDSHALSQLNHFLRDWRNDEQVAMAPQLFDVVWYAYREVGATEPIKVVSAYRSPNTNAMLARRSRAVAKNSHHMRGNAMDFHIPGISMAKVREIGMRLQRGGVGYYPTAGSPFVHLDVGTVRSWPRMPREQLERLFPDGKTVHIPADGVPLANYQLALAEVQARGGSALDYDTVISNRGKSLWALLFGSGEEDDGGADRAPVRGRNAVASRAPAPLPATSGDNVMVASVQPSLVTAFASSPSRTRLPRQTELRPQPGSEPVTAIAPPVATPEPVATPAPPQVASLPVPPIRPRGLGETALAVAGPQPVDLPLPPRRSRMAEEPSPPASPAPAPAPQVAGLVPTEPLVAAPALALPPRRSGPVIDVALAAPAAGPVVEQTVAAQLPLPPVRMTRGAGAAPPQPEAPRVAANAQPARSPVAVRTTFDAAGRGDIAALIAAESARLARPSHVVNVAPPPVEREVKRGVVAMALAKAPPAAESNGRFAGRFIRPMAARFTQAGE